MAPNIHSLANGWLELEIVEGQHVQKVFRPCTYEQMKENCEGCIRVVQMLGNCQPKKLSLN